MCLLKEIAIKRIPLKEDFDIFEFYNDRRGSSFKQDLRYLVSESIKRGLITIEKYVTAQNVEEKLTEVLERKGTERRLFYRLKEYHNEREEVAASLLYTLRALDPTFAVTSDENELKIKSELYDIEICPRIDQKNAVPRLFLTQKKVALISTNEQLENLADILAVKGVTVYSVDVDYWEDRIYAYKIVSDHRFVDLIERFKDDEAVRLKRSFEKYYG